MLPVLVRRKQEQALKELGFEVPYPDKKEGKYKEFNSFHLFRIIGSLLNKNEEYGRICKVCI